MSAGPFVISSYEATYDPTNIHPIRVQPETLTLTVTNAQGNAVDNAPPTAPVNIPISAKVSGGRRELGLMARKVTIQFTGTPPTGYQPGGRISLPWLDADTFPSLAKGQVVGYLNSVGVVTGLTPEAVN